MSVKENPELAAPHPWLKQRVEYRRDHADWGTGILEVADEDKDLAVVTDDIDKQRWFGSLESVCLPQRED